MAEEPKKVEIPEKKEEPKSTIDQAVADKISLSPFERELVLGVLNEIKAKRAEIDKLNIIARNYVSISISRQGKKPDDYIFNVDNLSLTPKSMIAGLPKLQGLDKP